MQTLLTSTQPYVTELDLRHSLIPDELIDDLVRSMPAHRGPDLREDRARAKYDYVGFMQRMLDGERPAALVEGRNGSVAPEAAPSNEGPQSRERSSDDDEDEGTSEGSSYDEAFDEDVEQHQGGARLVASPVRLPIRTAMNGR